MGGRGVRMTTEISVNEWVEMYSWSTNTYFTGAGGV